MSMCGYFSRATNTFGTADDYRALEIRYHFIEIQITFI